MTHELAPIDIVHSYLHYRFRLGGVVSNKHLELGSVSKFRAGIRRRPKNQRIDPLSFKKGNNICNLCGEKRNLTDDHVPPQCCGNDKPIVARRLYAEELLARQVDSRSHNGLKFRTLCRTCNGEVLGAWDSGLGEFADRARSVIHSTIQLGNRIDVQIRAGAVLRSVLGHVVATKVQADQVPTDQKIRDYLVGGRPLDPAIKAYAWLYPFEPTIVSRDFTFVEVEGEGGKSPGIVSVLKFFPLALCVMDARDNGAVDLEGPFTALHPFAGFDPATQTTVQMWTRPIVAPGWPERPIDNHLVLGGRMYTDSITTSGPNGAASTPGKRIQAERWEGGDNALIDNVHAFVEIPE